MEKYGITTDESSEARSELANFVSSCGPASKKEEFVEHITTLTAVARRPEMILDGDGAGGILDGY